MDAVDALFDGGVGQAHHACAGVFGGEGVDFDLDGFGADAVNCRRVRFG